MKILYLEDESALREWTANELRNCTELINAGYEIDDYFRIDQVKEYFEEYKDEIALIITDLNMDDRWLGKQRNKSNGGYLTGAVWLEHFVYTQKPQMPTIIYSAYINLLNSKMHYLVRNNENRICVEKGVGDDLGFEGLLKSIKSILHIGG